MIHENLTSDNFILYCAKHYDNPSCHNMKEFYEDVRRIKYIKKLFTRYEKRGDLKERLILNHIIILNNVFGPEHLPRILFFKMPNYLTYLKPFLLLLNIMPDVIIGIGERGITYHNDDITMDQNIVNKLRMI